MRVCARPAFAFWRVKAGYLRFHVGMLIRVYSQLRLYIGLCVGVSCCLCVFVCVRMPPAAAMCAISLFAPSTCRNVLINASNPNTWLTSALLAFSVLSFICKLLCWQWASLKYYDINHPADGNIINHECTTAATHVALVERANDTLPLHLCFTARICSPCRLSTEFCEFFHLACSTLMFYLLCHLPGCPTLENTVSGFIFGVDITLM